MKREIAEARRKVGYEFFVFKTAINDLPASEIKQMADDYKERIAWALWARNHRGAARSATLCRGVIVAESVEG